MNRAPKAFCVISLTLACALTTTFGQVNNPPHDLLEINEFGQGLEGVVGNGILPQFAILVPGTVAQDPYSGLFTLSYPIQPGVEPGDVLIYDDPQHAVLSDIIRFDGQGHVFFFSQLQPGETPTLADVPQLPAPLTQFPIASFTETNLGSGVMGVDYLVPASALMPGSDFNLEEYLFISDVPEPATAFLLLLGASLFLLRKPRLAFQCQPVSKLRLAPPKEN